MAALRIYKEGQRFGRWTIARAYVNKIGIKWHHDVLCDCGSIRVVSGHSLKRGDSLSCGCLRKELVETHKMSKSREYHVWSSMIYRCNNKNAFAYKRYGGRGITVSKEWLSFENFIEDMGRRPSDDLTLERVDNNKGYSADNCIWADRCTQAANKRLSATNKTGCAGVRIGYGGKYTARIQRNKKLVFLGTFSKLEDAIAARVKAEETFNQTRGI